MAMVNEFASHWVAHISSFMLKQAKLSISLAFTPEDCNNNKKEYRVWKNFNRRLYNSNTATYDMLAA